jgi:hypothetical protein
VPTNASSAGISTIIPIYTLWLGVHSAIIGAGLLIRSIPAGEVAATFGYGITFALAITFLGATFALVSKYFSKAVLKVSA